MGAQKQYRDISLPPALRGDRSTLPEFVGRRDVLRQYGEWIEDIWHGEESHFISNLHGLAGMGKTWLTCELYHAVSQSPGFRAAWMSFETSIPLPTSFRGWQTMQASQALLESWKRLPSPPDAPLELDPLFTTHSVRWCGTPDVSDAEGAEGAADERDFFVLIIDAINQLEDGGKVVWQQLQKQVLEPLAFLYEMHGSRLLVVCVSQAPLRWDDWYLRERAFARPRLEAFTLDETRDLLTHYGLEASSDIIFSLTLGHPTSISHIIKEHLWETFDIPDQHDSSPEQPSATAAPEPEQPSATAAPEQDIHNSIAHLERQLDKDLFWIVGVLRQVDMKTIKQLLHHAMPAQPGEAELMVMLSNYRKVGLLVPDTRFRPLAFPQQARRMVLRTMRNNNMEQYAQVCKVLCDWYVAELKRLPVENERYFTEWLYFSLQVVALAQAGEPGLSGEAEESRWLDRLQELWGPRQKTENDALRKRIYTDQEVRELLYRVDIKTSVIRDIIGAPLRYPKTEINQRLEEYHPVYRWAIITYLFDYRFPRKLSADERKLLQEIADEFSSGFNVKMLESKLRTTQPDEDEKKVRRQAIQYITRFNEIHVITYNQKQKCYVMDRWIRKFLERISTEDQPERAQ